MDRMTGGELLTIRDWLGLTGDALARILHVDPRTLRAWEAGKYPIPDGVREEIEQLEEATARAVGEVVDALNEARDPAIAIYRSDAELHAARPGTEHLSARWWRHVVARAVQEVPGVEIGTSAELAGRTEPLQAIITLRDGKRTATIHGAVIDQPQPKDLDSPDADDQIRDGGTPEARARLGAWLTAIAHLDADQWPAVPEDGTWPPSTEIRYEPAAVADLPWDTAWSMALNADVSGWAEGWVEQS